MSNTALFLDFYDITKGSRYDWFGMLLSQFLPFRVKQENKWYCSEWILYALRISCVIDWKIIKIYLINLIYLPAKLHYMLLLCNLEKTNLEFTNE